MQHQIIEQPDATIAPEPGRTITRSFFLLWGSILGICLVVVIVALSLPQPWRDELLWKQFYTNGLLDRFLLILSPILLPFIYIGPFVSMPVMTSYKRWKWRALEKNRRQAIENYLSGRESARFPLPEIETFSAVPLSLCLRRNRRTTLIWGIIYAFLIGIPLWFFVLDWQSNIEYLTQQGEISGWAVLGSVAGALACIWLSVPAISAFILAPRQHLVATQDGVICYRGLSVSFIPWYEARLFAVIAEQKETLVYELCSKTDVIRWSDAPAWNYGDAFPAGVVGVAPLGLVEAEDSREAYQRRARQLTALVAARTGLPLYDLRVHP